MAIFERSKISCVDSKYGDIIVVLMVVREYAWYRLKVVASIIRNQDEDRVDFRHSYN